MQEFVVFSWRMLKDQPRRFFGRIPRNEGRYDEAVEKLKWVRANMNTVPRLLEYELATALRADGRTEEALQVLEDATTGTSWEGLMYDIGTGTLALRSLGEVYDELGRQEEAIDAY